MRDKGDTAWLTARPIAHRGYHDAGAGRVENTLPAFDAAIARNFAIECDVRETADGQVVVFHDSTLDRLTERSGPLAAQTLGDLRSARFRQGDVGVPSLDDLLDLVDGRVPLFVEIKTVAANGERLAKSVAAALATYTGPVAVMSFEPATMTAMRSAAPQVPRGMLISEFGGADPRALSPIARFALRNLFAAPFVLPRFVGCDVDRPPASAPLGLRHFFGTPLLAWTVRSPIQRDLARTWADQVVFEGFDPDA